VPDPPSTAPETRFLELFGLIWGLFDPSDLQHPPPKTRPKKKARTFWGVLYPNLYGTSEVVSISNLQVPRQVDAACILYLALSPLVCQCAKNSGMMSTPARPGCFGMQRRSRPHGSTAVAQSLNCSSIVCTYSSVVSYLTW
jgi:hypothetical protein